MVRWLYLEDRQGLEQNTPADRDTSSEETRRDHARAMDYGPTNHLCALVGKFDVKTDLFAYMKGQGSECMKKINVKNCPKMKWGIP